MKVGIINYGMGNLASVKKSFEDLNSNPFIANVPKELINADYIILPGVGSFKEGMQKLKENRWIDILHELVFERNKLFLGICLGMQMLATFGEEGGKSEGLNFIPGKVLRMDKLGCKLRIPHVGWNEVENNPSEGIFKNIPSNSDFYFVHSYAFESDLKENIVGTTKYDVDFTSAIQSKNIFGCQFHPEKSSKAGLQILRNFLAI